MQKQIQPHLQFSGTLQGLLGFAMLRIYYIMEENLCQAKFDSFRTFYLLHRMQQNMHKNI